MNQKTKHRLLNILTVVVIAGVLGGVMYWSQWVEWEKQERIDNNSMKIVSMSCPELKEYLSNYDNGPDSREGLARSYYYYADCHVDHGWLEDSGWYCERTYYRFGPGSYGDDWDCREDYYPRDRENKIIYFPADWYYIDDKGKRIDDPTYVLDIWRGKSIYILGEYKGVIDPNLTLPKYGDIYHWEIEQLLKSK